MKWKLPCRNAGLSLLLAWTLTGCGESGADRRAGEEGADSARYGGTVVIGIPADIQSINPLTSSDANSSEIRDNLLFMSLTRYNDDLRPVPYLAEAWDTVRTEADSLQLTFHLRDDVRWHDGAPTTAYDVKFTFDRALDPQTAYPNRSALDLWSRNVEVIDSFTVRFTLRPHSEYMAGLTGFAILPEHILGDVPPAELSRVPFNTREPVGNGPFRFVRWVPNQEWVFEANEFFPEELGGRPYLDRVVFRVIPEQTTMLTELLTGTIDVYPAPSPAQASSIEEAPGVQLLSTPYRAYTYIGWNTQNPLFADARVRRALSLAIDRHALVDALLYGHGDVGISTSTPAHWAYTAQRQLEQPYAPDSARALLAAAGWQDRDGDGVLENEAGTPFRFTLVTNQGNDLRRDAGEIVQAQLSQIGVDAELRLLEWNTLIGMLDGSLNARGERVRSFDAVISGWVNAFRKDDAPLFHSRNRNDPYQETSFSDARIDSLIDTLAVTMDREQALPMWIDYHRILLEEAPYTVLYYPRRLMGVRDRVHDVTLDVRGDLAGITAWWVE